MSNGLTTTGVTNPFTAAASGFSSPTMGKIAGQEQTIASYAAPYVTEMLGKTQALTNQPYQTYQGPLTAGSSPLQMQAFQGIGGLAPSPGLGTAQQTTETAASRALGAAYQPIGGSFTQEGIAGQYMNPYLQQVLQPQLQELNRQAQIQQMQNASRMTKAGAFGGGRQAIMDAELQRNLLQQTGRTTGEAYANAFDKAMAQYNAEQARRVQEAQYGAGFGLDALSRAVSAAQAGAQIGQGMGAEQRANLAAQLGAGATQRDIEQQGIAADLAEFQQQRDYPYKQLQFQQAMLQNMPISAANYTYMEDSPFAQTLKGTGGLMGLYERLFGG